MAIFKAQRVLDGRNQSKYIPKSYRTVPNRPIKPNLSKKKKARRASFMQRIARRIQRIFS